MSDGIDVATTLTCPYCEYIEVPDATKARGAITCENCGGMYIFTRAMKIVYDTEKLD